MRQTLSAWLGELAGNLPEMQVDHRAGYTGWRNPGQLSPNNQLPVPQ